MSLQRFGKSMRSQKKNLWKHNLHNTGSVRASLSPSSWLSKDNGSCSSGRFIWPLIFPAWESMFKSHLSGLAVYLRRSWMHWGVGWAARVPRWVLLYLLSWSLQGDFTDDHSTRRRIMPVSSPPRWETADPLKNIGGNIGYPVGAHKVLWSRHGMMSACKTKKEIFINPFPTRIQKHFLHQSHFCHNLAIANSRSHSHQVKRCCEIILFTVELKVERRKDKSQSSGSQPTFWTVHASANVCNNSFSCKISCKCSCK